MTVVSGEWQAEPIDKEPAQTDDAVSLMGTDSSEPIEPDSPEGQMILVEAVRSLERRLSPEARATVRDASRDLPAEPEEFNPDT